MKLLIWLLSFGTRINSNHSHYRLQILIGLFHLLYIPFTSSFFTMANSARYSGIHFLDLHISIRSSRLKYWKVFVWGQWVILSFRAVSIWKTGKEKPGDEPGYKECWSNVVLAYSEKLIGDEAINLITEFWNANK